MALFGLGGAIAGAQGNTVTYYHCLACGHTLNRCMSDFEKNNIDSYLSNPKENETMLRIEKSFYPNIEWKDPAVDNHLSVNTDPAQGQQAEDRHSIAMAILDTVYDYVKPCSLPEIQHSESCEGYSWQSINSVLRELAERNIIEEVIINKKRYYKAIPNLEEDEAIKKLGQ